MTNQINIEKFVENHSLMIDEIIEALSTIDVERKHLRDQLRYLSIASEYVLEQLYRKPYILEDLIKAGDLYVEYSGFGFKDRLANKINFINTYDALEKALREFRHREMIRIVWRDVFGYAALEETLRDLSGLADACILQSLTKLQGWLEKKFGAPVGHSGERQVLHTITMGKLGGRELNFSSDIDLIFCYADKGLTDSIKKPLNNQEFFIRLAQQFMVLLGRTTEAGFVFRVDMRLRPYGSSGSLVTSLSTLKEYLTKNAMDWERYAFVKARIISEDDGFRASLATMLKTFVFESEDNIVPQLKSTKKRLCRFQQASLNDDIKKGRGGIRAVEFIVQVFQLIYGNGDQLLRDENLLNVLSVLKEKRYLKRVLVDRLHDAYCFLRLVENRLQMLADQHTHHLPSDDLTKKRLAKTLGFVGWQHFIRRLDKKRKFVAEFFSEFVEKRLSVCQDEFSAREVFHYGRQRDLTAQLSHWRKKLTAASRLQISLKPWQSFVVQVLYFISNKPPVEAAISRLINLLDILDRANKLDLLNQPAVCFRLMKLCVTSDWVVGQLVYHESLLVDLLSAETINLPPYLKEMQAVLAEHIESQSTQNIDEFIASLVNFKQHYLMKVAMADVLGQLPIMRVSDALTDIAIAVLRELLNALWEEMVAEYGRPKDKLGKPCESNFIIVAYGKLGGIELGYSSDLDLIFLHDADENALTDGENAISGFQFYTRLTQRLVKAIDQQTPYGKLYTIDTRLKPMGQSGMLVNSIDQFAEYQKSSAWTWEHQALVRARAIAGDRRLGEQFKSIRNDVLSTPRNLDKLKQDIIEMREKMRAEKSSLPGRFHLKRDPGGITDIEFLAQYIVLAWSQHQSALLIFPDNIRIFETCESASLLPRIEVDALCDAYRAMRKARHHLWLLGKKGIVESSRFTIERQQVKRAWESLLS